METGVKISGTAHGVLICAAVFGAPIFSSDNENTIKVSEVSLISSEEFAAVYSGNTDPIEVEKPKIIPVEIPKPEEVVVKPKIKPEVITPPKEAEPEPVGDTDVEDPAPVAEIEKNGETTPDPIEDVAPKQAEVISDEVVTAPEEPTEPDTKQVAATAPTPSDEKVAVKPEEPEQPAAPKETTTEIVTEAEKKVSELAPARTSRPKGRPKDLKLAVKEPEKPVEPVKPEESEQPQDNQQSIEDQIAEDIAKAIAEANAEAAETTSAVVSGPPLNGSEMSGLVFAIQQCWNVPIGLQNDASNVVTMGISLTQDGRLSGEPIRISPETNSATGIVQAFDAARRALIRCQPYTLPPEKYETWREMEIVFNPRNMVLR